MPRPRNIIPTKTLNLAIPLPLFVKVELTLYSEVEERVPLGAYSRFFAELIERKFEEEVLDLAPWLGELVPSDLYLVRGDAATINALKEKLA